MRVQITLDIDEEMRFAINARLGQPGRADRPTVIATVRSLIDADLEDIVFDYTMSRELENGGSSR